MTKQIIRHILWTTCMFIVGYCAGRKKLVVILKGDFYDKY